MTLLSPAMARPAVIDSAAVSVIAFKPKRLRELVIVVILAVTPDGVLMTGRYDGFNAVDVIWVTHPKRDRRFDAI